MEVPRAYQEQLEIWQNDPMTQWYFTQIDNERGRVREYMGDGGTIDIDNVQYTAQETSKHYGMVSGLDYCTEFDYGGEEDES